MTIFTPSSPAEVLATIQWAAAEVSQFEILGHGSKRGIGRPLQTEHTLDLSELTGVTLYEPKELVLSARAGTSLAEIENLMSELEALRDLLHAEGQRVQREISGYAQLSQAAMKSTRMIADNVAQWKRTADGLRHS